MQLLGGSKDEDLVEPQNACWQVDDDVEQNIIMQLMAGSDEDDDDEAGEGEDDEDDDDDGDDDDDDDDDNEEVRACCETKTASQIMWIVAVIAILYRNLCCELDTDTLQKVKTSSCCGRGVAFFGFWRHI